MSIAYPTPTVTAVSPNNGPAGGGTTVTITGTNFTGATLVDFGGVSATSFTVNSATSITAVSPANANSNAGVDVIVTNPSASSAQTGNDLFHYIPPTITVTNPALPAGTVGTAYSQTFAAIGGTTPYSYSVSAGALPAGLTLNSSTGTLSGMPLTATTYIFTVKATDAQGFPGTQSYSITVNAGPPGAPTIGTATAGNAQATVTFTAPTSNGGATINSYAVTTLPGGVNTSCASSPCTVTGLINGQSYSFDVYAISSLGAGSPSAVSNPVTPQASQTITFINPGSQNYGTSPTLTATATSGLSVTFSSSTTTVCTITPNGALTFVAPGYCIINANQAGNNAWLAAPQVSQSFLIAALTPTITGVTPGNGPSAGGTAVVIHGTDFFTGAAVSFGGVAANNVVVVDSNTIAAPSPAGTVGTIVDITVTTVGGTSLTVAADRFTYTGPYVYTVTNYGDAAGGSCTNNSTTDPDCSLRAAITQANALTSSATSIAIHFNATAAQTIPLGSGLTLSQTGVPVTINGATAGSGASLTNLVTVQGGGSGSNFTVFTVNSGVTAAISRLNITGGKSTGGIGSPGGTGGSGAGGILNNGALTLSNNTLSNNTGTGGNGGGGNGGNGGGGILNNGTLTLTNSTLSGNTGNGGNGGNGNGGNAGGGILNNGTLTLTNSTLSNNTGTGGLGVGSFGNEAGGLLNTSQATVSYSTIAGNWVQNGNGGGGIANAGALSLTGSIVAGNLNTGGTPYESDLGGTAPATNTNNLTGLSAAAIQLAPLGNYGGPTQTQLPLPGSPAICAGVASPTNGLTVPATDQRGVARPQNYGGTSCIDVGAAQSNYTLSFVTQPSETAVNAAMSPAPVVQINENGVAFTTVAQTLSLALTTGSGNVSDGSATTVTTAGTSAGQASYSALSIDTAGTGDVLTASLSLNSSPAVSITATSNAFNIDSIAQAITNFIATPLSPTYAPGGTFTVSATGGASGNPVTFSIASTSASVCSASGTNGATITILAAGACTVLADQAGNISYTAAPEVSLPVTIAKASQTITFGAQAAQTYSSGGTFAISPLATASSSLTVTYSSQTSSVCTVSNSTVTIVSAGTCTLAADQAGNGNYLAASEATQSVTIGAATSGTALTSSAATAVFGQSVTLTATVTGQTPTGSVTFNDGTTVLCSTVSVSGGGNSPTATCSTSALAVGAHAISASYTSANANNGNSSASLNQTVNAAATTTTITPPASISLGQSVTVSASVAVTSPGAGTPSGTIAIRDGGTESGDTCTITLPATSCSLAPSSAGTATLTATYSGNSDFVTSTGTVTLSVSTMTSSITLTSSPNPSTAGQAVTLTATVSAVTPASVGAQFTASGLGAPSKPHATFPEAGMINRAPASGIATVPTGSVTFSDGGAVLATVALNANGVATYSTTALTAGSHSISASYSGDANDAVATITEEQQVNSPIPPTPAVSAPTLSTWMLALLGLTLACAGLRYARRQTMH